MKISLKLTFFYCLFLIFSCHDSRNVKTNREQPAISYREHASELTTDSINSRIYQERRNYTAQLVPDSGTSRSFRERGNDLSPEAREEFRRQRNAERNANIEWVKASVSRYSPGSWHMLMEYDNLPEKAEVPTTDGGIVTTEKAAATFQFLKGRSRIDLLASMETNVHEIAHAYFDQNVYRYLKQNNMEMNMGNTQGYIYISPSKSIFITYPLKDMFPSGRLLPLIPEDLRTYRFDTYIGGNTSTQSDGLIGLLNELNAYYLGSEYCFNMLEPYKEAAGSDAAGVFEWVTHTQSTMSAFYEFDFFIKEYLLLMKREYGTEYEKLKSYRAFSDAYITVHKSYSGLIGKYQDRIEDEMKILNSSGKAEARIEKGWLWIKAGNSHVSSGTPIFSEEKEILLSAIESKKYREIEKDFPVK
jgi:hypothetical protein